MAAALAGCAGSPQGSAGRPGEVAQPPSYPEAPLRRGGLTPPFMASREITRVGLLLPFSTLPQEAQGLYDAAELALFDQGDRSLLLIPRDVGADARTARSAAEAIVNDGAGLIIGPVVRDSVLAAKGPARGARAPLIAFSSDSNVAGDGAYLLSFPLEEEVRRVIRYAGAQGLRRVAVLAPDTEYGRRAEAEARRFALQAGAFVVTSQLYAPTENGAAAGARAMASAAAASGVQAVLIPDGGAPLRAATAALQEAGLGAPNVRLLGTGAWGLNETVREPTLAGAWVAAPDPAARRGFERRFKSVYGQEPTRLASLAYDAVSIAALLARARGADGFQRLELERADGFLGADGLFRFRADGTIERALPVLQVGPTGAITVLDPAPTRFPPTGT